VADIVDAAYGIKKPFKSTLPAHGLGKNRSTAQALYDCCCDLIKDLAQGKQEFLSFFCPSL
jgi:hypothetical protein